MEVTWSKKALASLSDMRPTVAVLRLSSRDLLKRTMEFKKRLYTWGPRVRFVRERKSMHTRVCTFCSKSSRSSCSCAMVEGGGSVRAVAGTRKAEG